MCPTTVLTFLHLLITHWPKAIPLTDTRADTAPPALVVFWIATYGVQAIIATDHGSQFKSTIYLPYLPFGNFQCCWKTAYQRNWYWIQLSVCQDNFSITLRLTTDDCLYPFSRSLRPFWLVMCWEATVKMQHVTLQVFLLWKCAPTYITVSAVVLPLSHQWPHFCLKILEKQKLWQRHHFNRQKGLQEYPPLFLWAKQNYAQFFPESYLSWNITCFCLLGKTSLSCDAANQYFVMETFQSLTSEIQH